MVDEVLVHISTPATRQNDDLFRALADAYLAFEPHSQLGHVTQQRDDEQMLSASSSRLAKGIDPTQALQERAVAGASMLSTSKDSYGSFPSHISSGFGDHADADVRSIGPDSVPTSSRLAHLDRIHRRWKEQITPISSVIKDRRQSTPSSRSQEEHNTAFIEDTQLGAQALQSQLQDSYSTTDEDTSEGEPELVDEFNRPPLVHNSPTDVQLASGSLEAGEDTPVTSHRVMPLIHVNQIRARAVEAQETVRAESGVPFIESIITQRVVSQLEPTRGSSRFNVQVPSKKRKVLEEKDNQHIQDFSKLSFDAFAPAPKVSTERPGRLPSQVTKHLAAIKAQNPKRFKYSKKYRTLKDDERGYWSIACSTWPSYLQHEFWTSLCEHVSSGRLGWGTTLHREASDAHTLGQVRLYCWAEVAEHMWLILWLCSKGQTVGSASKWIDSGGTVVLEVA